MPVNHVMTMDTTGTGSEVGQFIFACVSELVSLSSIEKKTLVRRPSEPCSQFHQDSPGMKRSFPCLNNSKDSSKFASLVLRKSRSILLSTALRENRHQNAHAQIVC